MMCWHLNDTRGRAATRDAARCTTTSVSAWLLRRNYRPHRRDGCCSATLRDSRGHILYNDTRCPRGDSRACVGCFQGSACRTSALRTTTRTLLTLTRRLVWLRFCAVGFFAAVTTRSLRSHAGPDKKDIPAKDSELYHIGLIWLSIGKLCSESLFQVIYMRSIGFLFAVIRSSG